MKNILVTGGAGFIGSNFIRTMLQEEPELQIINLDALTYAGSLENLNDLPDPFRHIFVKGDICDNSLVTGLLQRYEIDTIVHFAAESHVDRSILGPLTFVQTNLVGTFTLLEAARQVWSGTGGFSGKRFHHISTDEVFGTLKPNSPAFSEVTSYNPRSPYSATKAGSDHLVRAYFHTYNLPITITNCSNNYGPYQFPEKLIPLMVLNAFQGKPLPVYGDGKQIRDWLYVEDHCKAIQLILTNGKSGETYNIGGGNQPSNMDMIQQICILMDELHLEGFPHEQLITQVPDRPGHDRRYAMDISKIQSELGWVPKYNLMTGLRSTVEWYLNHREWVDAIVKQGGYNDWINKNYSQRGGKA